MKPRAFVPEKLDVAVFAREDGSLEGEWPAVTLQRLADSAAPEAPASGWPALRWSLRGEIRQPKGGKAQTWLHLRCHAEVALTCQRCLKPVTEALDIDRWIRFVESEAEAEALDADSEDDVLALPRHLDARELIEDELLLALPLVPRHETCPEPLAHVDDDEEADAELERPNPFAALAALKKSGGSA
ncbi:YceD family protein [Roseateles sp. DC23W]|uniref:Large ribosomal RNA subunit accumulation protein YceD n=1 Tax=Pelomonas dachongensis TaxID=3299029 RepID=A0ABW7EU45_9BURK